MNIFFYIILSLFLSSISLADYRDADIQSEIQSEYGNCYGKFAANLENCTVSSCNYPLLSTTDTWRAHIINGFKNNLCYIIYYSYVGSNIVGSPSHCFYSQQDQRLLYTLYKDLFNEKSAISIAELKAKIIDLNNSVCKINQVPAQINSK